CDPVDDLPAHLRLHGGIRIRLDAVQVGERAVHLRVRAADRAVADGARSAAAVLLDLLEAGPTVAARRHTDDPRAELLADLGRAHDVRAAARHLPAAQLHLRDPERGDRGGTRGRGDPRADLLPDRSA